MRVMGVEGTRHKDSPRNYTNKLGSNCRKRVLFIYKYFYLHIYSFNFKGVGFGYSKPENFPHNINTNRIK